MHCSCPTTLSHGSFGDQEPSTTPVNPQPPNLTLTLPDCGASLALPAFVCQPHGPISTVKPLLLTANPHSTLQM